MAAAPAAFAVGGAKAQMPMSDGPTLSIVSRHLQFTDWQGGLDAAIEADYPGIIWSVRRGAHIDEEHVRELPQIVEATRAAGLEVPMIITRISDVDTPNIEEMLDTFSGLGITRYRAGTPRYDYSRDFASQYDELHRKLEALQELNAKYGTTACFHTHSSTGSLGGVGWDLWMTMRDLDPRYIGINFDIGHIVARTAVGWRDIAHAARSHIRSLSLKDVVAWQRQENPREGAWPWERTFVPPGEGMVDWETFFSFFHDTNFTGPMEVYHEYTAPIPGSNERINMLGRSYGDWELEVSRDYFVSLLARDVAFYKAGMRKAGFNV
jgi:sugar phosphate isomerase/epimerase